MFADNDIPEGFETLEGVEVAKGMQLDFYIECTYSMQKQGESTRRS